MKTSEGAPKHAISSPSCEVGPLWLQPNVPAPPSDAQ